MTVDELHRDVRLAWGAPRRARDGACGRGTAGAERPRVSAASTDPDFLIVGAGAAGGVVAKELATAGFRVVVLEQGPWLREPDFKHDEIWANQRHALTNDHRPPAQHPPPDRGRDGHAAADRELRARMVGGGSVHFTANYWRFRELDFVERSRHGALAGHRVRRLADHLRRARAVLHQGRVGARRLGSAEPDPFDPPRSRPYPLPPLPSSRSACWPSAPRGSSAGPPPVADGDPVAAYAGRVGLRALRVLRGLRLRDAGEERARSSTVIPAAVRTAAARSGRELRPEDRGGPPRAGDGRRLLRPRREGDLPARPRGGGLRQRRGDAAAAADVEVERCSRRAGEFERRSWAST